MPLHILSDYGALFYQRSQNLIPILVAGFFFGEFVARYFGVDGTFALIARVSRRWMGKLDKAERGIAKRLYRGMITMLILLIPAMILGIFIAKIPALSNLLMVALFGRAFETWRLFRRWRAARATTLGLELPTPDFLFADSHAVLRYSILHSAESFAVGVVGGMFWYLIGGLPCALTYLVLHEIAVTQSAPIYGWASNGFFRVVNFIPHLFALLFLALAALFVPRAKPWAAFKAKRFHGFISYLLNISLGGALPMRELSWEGTGTPKALPEHLARWLLMQLAATLLLLFALAAPVIANILKLI